MIIIPFHSKLDGLMLDEVREQEFFGSIQVVELKPNTGSSCM